MPVRGDLPLRFVSSLLAAAVLAASSACVAQAAPQAPPLAAYGRLPAIDNVALSPSGERFAVIESDKDGRTVYVRQTADGKVVRAFRFGAAKLRALTWAGDDHLLVINTATMALSEPGARKHEWEGVIHLDLRGSAPPAMLLAKSNTYVDAIFGWYGAVQTSGHWYAYVGAVPLAITKEWSRSEIFADLYRINLDDGKVEVVVHSSERDRDWLVSPAGEVIAHTRFDAVGEATALFSGTGEAKALLQVSGPGNELGLGGLGRRPGTVLVRQSIDGKQQLREIPLDGSGPGEVLMDDAGATRAVHDRDTDLLIGFATHNNTHLFDPAAEARVHAATAAFAGDRSELVSSSRTFSKMIFSAEGPKNAGRYYLVDMASRAAFALGDARPEVGADQVGPVRMVAYKAADGLAMEGVLTLPPGRDPKGLPLVVMPHGGPIVEGDTVSFDWWAQAYASHGYAVFQPNYRGTLGYGDAFRKAAEGQFGRKMQTDISDGVAALAKDGAIDPKRVCIVGASYGGYAALAGVTLQQGLYRCAVAVAGVADMRKMLNDIRSNAGPDRRALEFWHGLAGAQSQDLDAISPARLAAKADAPVLLIHGENDTVVPITQSQLMERSLRQAGQPVELVTMPGEDHWLSVAATRQVMLEKSVAFVEKHNPAN
jgi:acetyl esterase/lipase